MSEFLSFCDVDLICSSSQPTSLQSWSQQTTSELCRLWLYFLWGLSGQGWILWTAASSSWVPSFVMFVVRWLPGSFVFVPLRNMMIRWKGIFCESIWNLSKLVVDMGKCGTNDVRMMYVTDCHERWENLSDLSGSLNKKRHVFLGMMKGIDVRLLLLHSGRLTAGTWKSPVWKGKSSSKPSCLGSMLIFRGVHNTSLKFHICSQR